MDQLTDEFYQPTVLLTDLLMHDITDDAVLLLSFLSLHYSRATNLSNEKEHYNFLLQECLMEHNIDQKTFTAVLLLDHLPRLHAL